jgi:hypothetical protein
MSALIYLIEIYWPFLAIALLIGIATGWYGSDERN